MNLTLKHTKQVIWRNGKIPPAKGHEQANPILINLQVVLSDFEKEKGTHYKEEDLLRTAEFADYYLQNDSATKSSQAMKSGTNTPKDGVVLSGPDDSDWPTYSPPRILYYYHPDYLGNVEYITDMDGLPYQYFFYSPWGEALKDQTSTNYANWNSPYKFNGKEQDDETGLFYYGARYYNAQTSVWLSVDAKSSERRWLSPYNYVQNNPVMLIDPDGNLDKATADYGKLLSQFLNQAANQESDQNSSVLNEICETCPKEEAYDLYRQSEVNFSYDKNSQRVSKADDKKLDMNSAKNPHLEALTFLKYSKQGDGGSNTMTDYFDKNQLANAFRLVEISQVVDGVPVIVTVTLDSDYPISGGKITYPNERGFEGTGANGPSSRLRLNLKSGYLKGAEPSSGVQLLSISYPYTQKAADLRIRDKNRIK